MKIIKSFFTWYRESWLYTPSLFFIGVVIFTLIMDNIVMPYYVKLGEETELPDVIEMHISDAVQTLTNEGFQVIINDSLYEANYPVGTVIEQNPYPYATVKEGRRVYLSISIGEKPIIMPKMFGLAPRDAELILKSYGLKLRAKNYVFSDIYPEGIVVGQSYPQGQQIKRGTPINITVSLGKLQKEQIIPDLKGKSLREAKQRLRKIELKLRKVTFEVHENILPETVLNQSLKSGKKYALGDSIDLVVSRE